MSKERPFEDITPVPNIKVGYFEKEAYLEVIDRQAKQIESFAYQIMVLQAKISALEKTEKPQGDLISREALKKMVYAEFSNSNLTDAFNDIIDNAPPVFSCNACKNRGNEQECIDRHDYSNYVHYDERPQGEWKVYGRQGGVPISDYCTNCKYEIKWYKTKYNFCPNCGAKMKGGVV